MTMCPFCRQTDSVIEPASELILDQIKKLKFYCVNAIKGDQCLEIKAMNPRELLKHLAFECSSKGTLNRYTLLTRDRNICRRYCTLKGFETT